MIKTNTSRKSILVLLLLAFSLACYSQNPNPFDGEPEDSGSNPDPYDGPPDDFDPPPAPIDDYIWPMAGVGLLLGGYYAGRRAKRSLG
jgi:hypothetical protein